LREEEDDQDEAAPKADPVPVFTSLSTRIRQVEAGYNRHFNNSPDIDSELNRLMGRIGPKYARKGRKWMVKYHKSVPAEDREAWEKLIAFGEENKKFSFWCRTKRRLKIWTDKILRRGKR